MQLRPRYGDDPVLVLDGPPETILVPVVRQRARLADTLRTFTGDQWRHSSRCEGWTNQDVIVHLDTTNRFWAASIAAGLAGTPTELLATFDPVTSPAELVESAGLSSPAEVLAAFLDSTEALLAQLDAVDGAGWEAMAEAPPGHLTVSTVAHHALWDAWVHERDVTVPLGAAPAAEPDELTACLRYVAGLRPVLQVNHGRAREGRFGIDVTDPDVEFTVAVGDRVTVRAGAGPVSPCLGGDALEVTEGLSNRTPLPADTSTELLAMIDTAF